MKKILKDILEKSENQIQLMKDIAGELHFQTQLMKDMFYRKDAKNHNAQHIQNHMGSLIANISKMKGMNTPEAQKILNDLLKIIPGG